MRREKLLNKCQESVRTTQESLTLKSIRLQGRCCLQYKSYLNTDLVVNNNS